jgi:hypothetical protein
MPPLRGNRDTAPARDCGDKNEIPIHQPDGTTIYLIHPVFMGEGDPTIVMTNSCMEIVREYGPLRGGFTAPSSNIPPEFRDESMANN